MYYAIYDFLIEKGYSRTSVWSFCKSKTKTYSSVTRLNYIGIGPSAASFTQNGYYFNTFSLEDYISTVRWRLPVALKMTVSERMKKLYWLYWKLYETEIPTNEYLKVFGQDISHEFRLILKILKILNFIDGESEDKLILNKRGCFWGHLFQNYFALNYISKIWKISESTPWPSKITL